MQNQVQFGVHFADAKTAVRRNRHAKQHARWRPNASAGRSALGVRLATLAPLRAARRRLQLAAGRRLHLAGSPLFFLLLLLLLPLLLRLLLPWRLLSLLLLR